MKSLAVPYLVSVVSITAATMVAPMSQVVDLSLKLGGKYWKWVNLAMMGALAAVIDVALSMLLLKSQRGVVPALADLVESGVSYAITLQLIRPYIKSYLKIDSLSKVPQELVKAVVPAMIGGLIYMASNYLIGMAVAKLK